MSSLLVILVILGCAAGLYLKGTIVRAFVMVISAICASVAAFGYFEILAKVFINKDLLVPWAQPLSFILLFIISFAILQTIALQLTRKPVDLGFLPERIGRVVCGFFLGLIISGLLLTAAAMAPLSNKLPYQRFNAAKPDPEKSSKALFNADGFATGWFNVISGGSLSGEKSFAALHAAFLDQLFLNRHSVSNKVSIITTSKAIEVPKKKAVQPAAEGLKTSKDPNEPVESRSGYDLTVAKIGIRKASGEFTPSQLRLICKHKSDVQNPLAGRGKNVYPVGYLNSAGQLQLKKLNEQIKPGDGKVKWFNFVFYVPKDFVPVLVEFKQNNIVQLPLPAAKKR